MPGERLKCDFYDRAAHKFYIIVVIAESLTICIYSFCIFMQLPALEAQC